MIIFKDLRLSLPYERVIFTKHANPNLASQAPNDKINSGVKISVWECIDNIMDMRTSKPKVIASRFNKHNRKFLYVIARAIAGIIIIRGSSVYIIIIKGWSMVGLWTQKLC